MRNGRTNNLREKKNSIITTENKQTTKFPIMYLIHTSKRFVVIKLKKEII